MEEIISYIINKYSPLCILVYGSYADGTNNAHSDFDCMIIVKDKFTFHDTSTVEDVKLDLFIYTLDEINTIDNYADLVQISDSRIIKDTNNTANRLVEIVNSYISDNLVKSAEEKENLISWMKKMLNRAERNDIEGFYRYHWVLTESLEIYSNLRDLYYLGPKKSIRFLKEHDEKAYELFDKALRTVNYQCLKDWIIYAITI